MLHFHKHHEFILNYPLENTIFYKFCQNCTSKEFLKSQTGFFYAVQAFPQMLSSLASKIEDPLIRLTVIENLWEEHGKGDSDKFHTSTFLSYLKSLGNFSIIIENNFFVNLWIKNTLNKDLTPSEYATYLSGIEYMYARLSTLICSTLNRFDLKDQQTHYKTHSELDFIHATELLQVAYQLDNTNHFEVFISAVEDFMDLFNQMTFITEQEAKTIQKEKISFYYSREDSDVELKYLAPYSKPSILCICSGGEHIINIKKIYPQSKILALDINSHQIQLAKNKFQAIKNSKKNAVFNEGKFELIFQYFANKISKTDIVNIKLNNPNAIYKLKLICDDLFSNHNLNIIFGEEATQYSSDNFSRHFYNVFLYEITNMNSECSNINNVLGYTLPKDLPNYINSDDIEFFCGDLPMYFETSETKYDMISISNIGDWMPENCFINLIDNLKFHINSGGCLIARKLLGDYSLQNIMSDKFKKVISENDSTKFYTECMVALK